MYKILITLVLGLILLPGKADKLVLKGESGKLQADRIYLCEVLDTYYGKHQIIDSAVVKNGKFTFVKDNIKPELYFLGTSTENGGYLFLESASIKVKPENIKENEVVWNVSGSVLDRKYRDFMKEKYRVTYQHKRDSLNDLFFKARAKDDRDEMARVKKESMPYYEKGNVSEYQLVEEWVKGNKDNELGAYLYATVIFRRNNFPTTESVKKTRAYLKEFGAAAQKTGYFADMEKKLSDYENCAIGAVAPEIVGLDTLGRPFKLSDLRGSYVVVDFWNSYCHWCREETPYLQKTLDRLKDKNLKILGVSSDRIKKLWLDAIHEDKSYWDHLMLQKGNDVMERYCIKGIPHILLIDPDGVILAKGMRWDEISEAAARYIENK